MKRYFYLLILFGFLLVSVNAQTIDCNATIKAWEADSSLREFMRTHRCSCPFSNQKPVCEERSSEPEPTPNPKPRPTPNPAEEQAKHEAAWKTRKSELLKLLKKADEIELPPTPKPLPTPNPAVYAELRAKTAQSIKQLNCSAFWGLEAVKTAVNANIEITSKLDDEMETARNLAEMSEGAEKGNTLTGCPSIQINVPEIPPPIEQNPQVRLYDSMIKDVRSILPVIIKIKKDEKVTKDWRDLIEQDKNRNRKEKQELNRKPKTAKNRAEKQKKDEEYDNLIKEALEAESQAQGLQNNLEAYRKVVSDYQNIYETVSKEPDRAKEFLPK